MSSLDDPPLSYAPAGRDDLCGSGADGLGPGPSSSEATAASRQGCASIAQLAAARLAASAAAGPETSPAGKATCVDCAGVGSPEVLLTMARFGEWEALLEEPLPPSWGAAEQAGYNEASFRYSRALALYTVAGRAAEADAEAARANRAAAGAGKYAAVIQHELAAVRAWRVDHDPAAAAAELSVAVGEVDGWRYMEPPRWYYPGRSCLGVALLGTSATRNASVNASAALDAFTADLAAYPENGRSLLGAARAYEGLGDGRSAARMRERAGRAWADADVELASACPQLA